MERIIDFIKKVKNVFLAWDYYGRGKPLPHNDVVKQKRLAESKLKRALSVLPRHSEERTEPTGVCSRRGIPHGRKGLILLSF